MVRAPRPEAINLRALYHLEEEQSRNAELVSGVAQRAADASVPQPAAPQRDASSFIRRRTLFSVQTWDGRDVLSVED